MTFNPISLDQYLDEHHHITESAIGMAILLMGRKEYNKAKDVLDDAVCKIDNIRRDRLAKICEERNLDLKIIDEIIPLR